MRISNKGQITIPAHLREELGLFPSTEVEFKARGDQLILRKAPTQDRGKLFVERLRGKGQIKITTDEIMAMTRAE